MSVSALQSGYQMINHVTQMSDEASREINRAAYDRPEQQMQESQRAIDPSLAPQAQQNNTPQQPKDVAEKKPDQTQVDALLKLNQATQYNRIGANVIQRDQDMIGSLLNIQA
ncbi:hypothetical protein [Vibrio mangrovi]|uniref:Uncharacterized protein n=1 Tax=Vibrio mangrovi TaxID=474394 RepID=A0A1Y6IV27_9VIBR|nr:hypothetical protein [Vibrio mangrovi]MDW6004573.1 hypothetical protein [Vibrio mangrovi]SMS00861.1 hypothetical protein VIM7927_02132 [Vibrio mangrovi]